MPLQGRIPFRDNDNDISSTLLNLPDAMTAAVAVQTLENITAAMLPVLLGLNNGPQVTFSGGASAGPVQAGASRTIKWLVSYRDELQWLDGPTNTIPNPGFGKSFTFTIPTADNTLLPSGSDAVDLSQEPWLTLVNQLQASVVSPYGGNISVQRITLTGRSYSD